MRYFIELAYNGAPFHGWQIQPNASSVQETIEKAISILCRREISITGAGRTDTGVNARQMFAHFDFEESLPPKDRMLVSLNRLVGKDIFIKDISPVVDDAHARFDAINRTYKYFIAYQKNPFLKDFCWQSPIELDLDRMNEASALLTDTKDFTSFAKLHSDAKTNICDVTVAEFKPIEEDKEALEFLGNLENGIVFTISADRFLRNMVRAVVGTLVDVGRGKLSIDEFKEIIARKDRCAAGVSMPAQALFLWHIEYPSLIFAPHSDHRFLSAIGR